MIIFDLVCEFDHSFEGWFKNSDEFHDQQTTGLLTCPVCDSGNVVKVPSASYINVGKRPESTRNEVNTHNHQMVLAQQVTNFIEKNFEDVGADFASTAKKMHYGEESERNIRGSATQEETRELVDEGIDIVSLDLKKNPIN